VAKTTGHKIYSDVASAGKKEGFLSYGSFVNYIRLQFFSFCYSALSIGHSDTGLHSKVL